jgi:hypothetical protein
MKIKEALCVLLVLNLSGTVLNNDTVPYFNYLTSSDRRSPDNLPLTQRRSFLPGLSYFEVFGLLALLSTLLSSP